MAHPLQFQSECDKNEEWRVVIIERMLAAW